eukprot:6181301-Pleurochrysis_carterae.AAC.1
MATPPSSPSCVLASPSVCMHALRTSAVLSAAAPCAHTALAPRSRICTALFSAREAASAAIPDAWMPFFQSTRQRSVVLTARAPAIAAAPASPSELPRRSRFVNARFILSSRETEFAQRASRLLPPSFRLTSTWRLSERPLFRKDAA